MSSPTLLTPTSKLLSSPKFIPNTSKPLSTTTAKPFLRRNFLSLSAATSSILLQITPSDFSLAAEESEYVKETSEVIAQLRNTINMEKNDPNVENAVTDLRERSNAWVAKYRREKSLLGKISFRDMYSALNAVSGHYISFGPTAPIPAKRKLRILEEMDAVEKALVRGR